MKLIVLFLTVGVLGSALAHPGWMSSLSSTVADTTNSMKMSAMGAAKATTNSAMNSAIYATNMAKSAAGSAVDMTKKTATAGYNFARDASMSAINAGIGFLIEEVKVVVRRTGKNVIEIPDVKQSMGPIHFHATKGYFRDVTTIAQSGKANVTMNGTSLEIDFPMRLDEIDIGYNEFNVSMWKLVGGGGIKVHIENNTFITHLRLTPGLTCTINLEKVEVADLSGYEIDFTDIPRAGEWVLEKASNLIVNAMRDSLKSKVQEAIDSAIRSAIKEDSYAICSKFLG